METSDTSDGEVAYFQAHLLRLLAPSSAPKSPKIWLVVEPYPSEKYEFVTWDDYSQLFLEKSSSHVPVQSPTR